MRVIEKDPNGIKINPFKIGVGIGIGYLGFRLVKSVGEFIGLVVSSNSEKVGDWADKKLGQYKEELHKEEEGEKKEGNN